MPDTGLECAWPTSVLDRSHPRGWQRPPSASVPCHGTQSAADAAGYAFTSALPSTVGRRNPSVTSEFIAFGGQVHNFLQKGRHESSSKPPCLEFNSVLCGVWQQSKSASKELELLKFDFIHSDALPMLTGPPQRGENQVDAALFRKEPRDDFRSALLLQEASFHHIRRPDAFVVDRRAAQVRDTGFPVILKRPHGRRVAVLIGFQDLGSDHPGHLLIGRIVGCLDHGLHLSTHAIEGFYQYVCGLVEQATLAQAIGKHLLDGEDQARRPVGGDQSKHPQATLDHVLQEIQPVVKGFPVAQGHVEHDFAPIDTDCPGTQHTLFAATLLTQRLVDRV
jgi:hypothetical protein